MQLNAGPVEVHYENGFLRTLTINGQEVLRMIYFALRDRDWNTAHVAVANETIRSETDTFVIRYEWQTDDLGIRMAGNVQIEGLTDGTISFDFFGKALTDFWRNRVGICVLHPIDGLAGQPCQIESPDDQTTIASFPDLISPYQPFLNVQALRWTMVDGQSCRVDFSGDVFETEDQRNWTDASYKTYCTPLERPYPAEVRAGTEIRQRIVFSIPTPPVGEQATTIQADSAPPATLTNSIRIGLGQRSDGPGLSSAEAQALQQIDLSHMRADVWFSKDDWTADLLRAMQDAYLLNVPLELATFFGTDAAAEARRLVEFLQQHTVAVYSILLFQADTSITTDALLNTVVPVLRASLPNVLLGGGTDGNFVDLNRYRFNFDVVDFVTYSINPQVHAFDDQTLMENVAGQAYTVRSARVLSGGKPVHISPVTLRPRYNPDAAPGTVRATPPTDPRLTTVFGAEWTRRSIQILTQAGAASATYYETHGPRGLVNGSEAYPVFDVFKNRD